MPVLELAEQTGLSRLIGEHVRLPSTRVKSGAVNPAGKLTSIIAAMMCGADTIDDADLLRAGGTPRVFDEVYAPSTLGIFLREFTFGHANQLAAVARGHLVALAARVGLLAGIETRAFIDIDSLLRPVYGHATTISTAPAAPVIAEARLRSGRAGSGRAAATQIKAAITTTRKCGASGKIMVRGDSAFGTNKVITACLAEGVEFSLSVSRNKRLTAAIEAIAEDAYTPVHYPGAVTDPDTGALISDAEVARNSLHPAAGPRPYDHRAAGGAPSQRCPLPRRVVSGVALPPVCDQLRPAEHRGRPDPPSPRHHRDHLRRSDRRAAGPHPVGLFSANCAWLAAAVIAHNLLRAAGTLAGGDAAVARGATLRRDLVNVPARFAAPARKPTLHLPTHWPPQTQWKTLWTPSSATQPRNRAPPDPTGQSLPTPGPTRGTRNKKKLVQASGSRMHHRATPSRKSGQPRRRPHELTHPRIQAKATPSRAQEQAASPRWAP